MDSKSKKLTVFDDIKIHTKFKLSALWISIMFCYVYGDFFGFFVPGRLAEIQSGIMGLGAITQGVLLGASIAMAIPSLMVVLSLVLMPTINRWVNIVFALLSAVAVMLTLQGSWFFYRFFSVVEIVLILLIVWYAWSWPKKNQD